MRWPTLSFPLSCLPKCAGPAFKVNLVPWLLYMTALGKVSGPWDLANSNISCIKTNPSSASVTVLAYKIEFEYSSFQIFLYQWHFYKPVLNLTLEKVCNSWILPSSRWAILMPMSLMILLCSALPDCNITNNQEIFIPLY